MLSLALKMIPHGIQSAMFGMLKAVAMIAGVGVALGVVAIVYISRH